MFLSLVGIKPFKLKDITTNFVLPDNVEIAKKNALKKLSFIAKPDLIIISNVSNNHLENFKSEKDIALAKSEIFNGLTKNGQVILNYDNKWFSFLKKIAMNFTDQIIPFGIKKSIFSILSKTFFPRGSQE